MKDFRHSEYNEIYNFLELLIELDKKSMWTNSEEEMRQIEDIYFHIRPHISNVAQIVKLKDSDCYLIIDNIKYIKKIIKSSGQIFINENSIRTSYSLIKLNKLLYIME